MSGMNTLHWNSLYWRLKFLIVIPYKIDLPCQNLPHFPLTKLHIVGTYPWLREFWNDDNSGHLTFCCRCKSQTSSHSIRRLLRYSRQDRNDEEEDLQDVGTTRSALELSTTTHANQRKFPFRWHSEVSKQNPAVGLTYYIPVLALYCYSRS